MDLVIMFWDVWEKMCHIYLPGVWAAVTGPLHQMNSVASKWAAEEFGAGADTVRLALCKHWGPPDRCALIAAAAEDAAARRGDWIPSLWRETMEPLPSSAEALYLIPGVEPSCWDAGTLSALLWCYLCLLNTPPSSFCPILRSSVGLIIITKSISSGHKYDVTYSCQTMSLQAKKIRSYHLSK